MGCRKKVDNQFQCRRSSEKLGVSWDYQTGTFRWASEWRHRPITVQPHPPNPTVNSREFVEPLWSADYGTLGGAWRTTALPDSARRCAALKSGQEAAKQKRGTPPVISTLHTTPSKRNEAHLHHDTYKSTRQQSVKMARRPARCYRYCKNKVSNDPASAAP